MSWRKELRAARMFITFIVLSQIILTAVCLGLYHLVEWLT